MTTSYQLNKANGCCANEENILPILFVTKNEILDSEGKPDIQVNIATGWMCDKCGFINTNEYALKYLSADNKVINLLDFKYTDWMVKYLKQVLETSGIKYIILNKIEPTEGFIKIIQELNLTIVPANDYNTKEVSQT